MVGSVSELRGRIGELSPEKRRILEQQLLKRRAGNARAEAIRPRAPGEPFPFSFSQQRLWFLEQFSPGSSAYNATLTMRLDGRVDVDALSRAFDTLVARHEVLRTVADDVGGLPEPRILEDAQVPLRRIDLRGPDGTASQERIDAELQAETSRSFDLSRDVMVRVGLLQVGGESHLLHIVLHHIACDGWSRGVLFDELSALYNAYSQDRAPDLPELRIQYGDFALWQQRWLQGQALATELDWWREYLAGANTVLDLPTDHPRPAAQTFTGARLQFTLSEEVTDAVREFGRQERTTVFMTGLAVLGILLSFETGQDDILVGSPVANRQRAETEPLIGFFVNTLLFRVRMPGDPTVREVVRQARENAIAAYSHQDVPFDKLVEVLRPRRHPGRNPLFQVNYRMQGPPPPPPQLTGLKTTRAPSAFSMARFDLALGIVDTPTQLRGYVEYIAALFERTTAQRLADRFCELLGRAVTQPDLRLSELRATPI
ncbi:MAG: hypothetical protein QOG43_2221 [Actinomycetota bacterium]|jgi:hypothetical protein|nr:hypothetical protein [Actinomycetota bacterium]